MPDGAHHHNLWKAGALVAIPASIYAVVMVHPYFALGMLGGYALGRYFDPDLDQVTITNSEARLMNEFKILGYVIVGYTTIYGAAFRRWHRSFLTHFPVVSTTIRLVFLFWWVIFLYRRWFVFGVEDAFIIAGVLFGLSIADSIHWAADKWFSGGEDGRVRNDSDGNSKGDQEDPLLLQLGRRTDRIPKSYGDRIQSWKDSLGLDRKK